MKVRVSVKHGGRRVSPTFHAATWIGLRRFSAWDWTEAGALEELERKVALFHANGALDQTYPKTLERN